MAFDRAIRRELPNIAEFQALFKEETGMDITSDELRAYALSAIRLGSTSSARMRKGRRLAWR